MARPGPPGRPLEAVGDAGPRGMTTLRGNAGDRTRLTGHLKKIDGEMGRWGDRGWGARWNSLLSPPPPHHPISPSIPMLSSRHE